MDSYDLMPEVAHFHTDFSAPCDLMMIDPQGVETVLHDCSTTGSTVGQPTCAALDVAVSFDGLEITYSLFQGTLYNVQKSFRELTLHPDALNQNLPISTLPNKRTNSDSAHIIKRTISSGATVNLTDPVSGIFDTGPAYMVVDGSPQGRIAFTSNRRQTFATGVFRSSLNKANMSIYSMDHNGDNITLDSVHSLAQDQHPLQLKNGMIAYSSWQIGGGLPFAKPNGPIGGFNTLSNLFSVWQQRPDGTLQFPLLGQHNREASTNASGIQFTALHNLAETTDGRIFVANYYRENNQASGEVTFFTPEGPGLEGRTPGPLSSEKNDFFMPTDVGRLTTWGTNRDLSSFEVTGFPTTILNHDNYTARMPWYGKVGWPFALPSNGLGVVWAVGGCSLGTFHNVLNALGIATQDLPPYVTGTGNGSLVNMVTEVSAEMVRQGMNGDIPGCNLGIYETTVIPSTTPADLVKIVDHREWHEIYPRALVPYTDIHGVAAPAVVVTPQSDDIAEGSPFGMFGAASIIDRETRHPLGLQIDPTDFNKVTIRNMFGTDTIEYVDDDLCGVRIVSIKPNNESGPTATLANVNGERHSILGEFFVRNKDGNGDPIITNGVQDTSFLVSLPANVPHSIGAIDCNGRALNFDPTWQSVKPKELKTCDGCHVHSRPATTPFATTHAATPGYVPFALGQGVVPLLDGLDGNGDPIIRNVAGYDYMPTFTDIRTIFESRCISCHSASGAPGSAQQEAELILDDFSVDGNGRPAIGSTWWRLVQDNVQTYVPSALQINIANVGSASDTFAMPQLTRYMKANNSLGSLLYWKAANARTDRRLDTDHSVDVDFGAAHPTAITALELATLSRWIDIGAPGPSAKDAEDTARPTLVMSAVVETGNITQLNIGTVDVGGGIDTGTLNVCLRNGATCTNIAPAAQSHGITNIVLGSAITDMTQVVEASVSDMQGNTTQISRVAQFLVDGGAGPSAPATVSINVGGNQTVTQGDTVSATIGFADGEDTNSDGWTAVVDWGGVTENINIAPGATSFVISRLMSAIGDTLVTVNITDVAPESASGSFTVTTNASGGGGSFSISVGGPAIVNEGVTLTRTIPVVDPDGNGGTYSVDWGGLVTENGTIAAGATSFNVTRLMPDGDARMTVNVNATSAGGPTSNGSFAITTLNVNPRGEITSPTNITVNTLYNLTYTYVDPGDDQVLTTSVDWGDGNFNNETTHTYTQVGTYKIKVQVVDEDGVHTVARKTVTVQ